MVDKPMTRVFYVLMSAEIPENNENTAPETPAEAEQEAIRKFDTHCEYISTIGVEKREEGLEVTVYLRERLSDKNAIRELGAYLNEIAHYANVRKLVIDHAITTSMSSLVLSYYLAMKKIMQGRGGELSLCNISPEVYEVFAITKLNHYFGVANPSRERLLKTQFAKEREESVSAARSTLGGTSQS